MDQRSNPRFHPRNNRRGNGGQCVDAAPQSLPTPPQTSSESQAIHPDVRRLQHELACVENHKQRIIVENGNWLEGKKRLRLRIHKLTYDLNRVEGLMELREKGFTAEHRKNYETIASYASQISSLKNNLQVQTERVEAIQSLNNQETEKMAASLEVEKQKVSEQNIEMFKLTLENQKTALLHNELNIKVNQLEQKLYEKDEQLLDLRRVNDDLSRRLLESDKTCVSELEEEKKELKKEVDKKQKEGEEDMKKNKKEAKEEAKKKQKEEKELKKKQKKEEEERKKKEKKAKAEMKKQEKKAKAEMKKQEKNEKKQKEEKTTGFWSWIHIKNDSNMEVEEAAG